MRDDWEPSWPDSCGRCHQDAVHELRPALHDGVLYTRRTCPRCGHEWKEQAPTVLDLLDLPDGPRYFRAYLDGETAVGIVQRVDGDTVWIAGRVVQRWQLVEY